MNSCPASPAKAARILQGLSLRDVAAVVGKSHIWVMRTENGDTVPCRQDRDRLSEALGVDLTDMPVREDFEP